MSEESPAPALAEPTEARFSMRSLFAITAALAVLAAILGPIVRQLSPENQFRLLTVWGTWLVAVMLCVAYQSRKRVEAERLAGATLLRLPMFDEKIASASPVRQWFNIVGMGISSLVMMGVVCANALGSRPGNELMSYVFSAGFWGFFSVWGTTRLLTTFWWRNNIRFCERGILWDRRLVPWDHVVERRWSAADENVFEIKGIDHRNIDTQFKFAVPRNQREQFELILAERASKRTSTPEGPSTLELGRIPISTAVKHPYFPRYVAGLVFRIVIFVGVLCFITFTPTGIREFDNTIFPGIFLHAIVMMLRWQWSGRQAGVPLVRLTGRRGALELIPRAGAAFACYLAATNYTGMLVWPFYVLGTAFWWSAATAVTYLVARQLDLRELGVVMQGAHFWPWDRVRIIKWDKERKGRLVLARGWQRIVALVPPEQREAVDFALREKLAIPSTTAKHVAGSNVALGAKQVDKL